MDNCVSHNFQQNLDYDQHMSWFFVFFASQQFEMKVVVCFVDMGGTVHPNFLKLIQLYYDDH